MAQEISNSDDVIDSRDVIARIEELECEREALADAEDEAQEAVRDAETEEEVKGHTETLKQAREALAAWDGSDEGAELKALQTLADEAGGYAPDWRHGATLIRDSYFETYARELAEDIGAISGDEKWPCTCIDWEKAASELQMDYTSVEFDGVTYWVQ